VSLPTIPVRAAELLDPVDLTGPRGRLNPAAIGYSRVPLHSTTLSGWGRNKRWEYWGIITPTHVIGLTLSSLDYAGVHQIYVLDRATGIDREWNALVPFARGVLLPDTPPPFAAKGGNRRMRLHFSDVRGGTKVSASAPGMVLQLLVPTGGDSLGVVVPWSEKRFQYTVKNVARRVSGSLTLDGQHFDFVEDESWAVLDRGRGRWPYRMTWNWAAGSGVVDGTPIGLQLGGRWTDGTGMTENALFVDGTLHYIPEDLDWQYDPSDWMAPWRVTGDRVEATLTPFHVRHARTNALIVASDTHQAFGEWSGWASDGDGQQYRLDGLIGWAEEAINRW